MLDEYYEFRRHLVETLERDLLGPNSPDEVITDPPTTKYIVGVLFPRNAGHVDQNQDLGEDPAVDADADDSESWDPAVSMSYVRYPSSMGMTLAVDTTATELITVTIGGARYVPVEREDDQTRELAAAPAPGAANDAGSGEHEFIGRRAKPREQPDWRRVPLEVKPIEIDVRQPSLGEKKPVAEGLELFQRIPSGRRARPGFRHARAPKHQSDALVRARR